MFASREAVAYRWPQKRVGGATSFASAMWPPIRPETAPPPVPDKRTVARFVLGGFPVEDSPNVENFLVKNYDLVAVLLRVRSAVQDLFGIDTSVRAEMFKDPDAQDDAPELRLRIQTRFAVAEALALLDRFDEETWPPLVPLVRGRARVDVEYLD
jgi:hypothetical protein